MQSWLVYRNSLDRSISLYKGCLVVLILLQMQSTLVISTSLIRMTAYLEVKIWSLFIIILFW